MVMNSKPRAVAGGVDALKIKMEIKLLTGEQEVAPKESKSPLTLTLDSTTQRELLVTNPLV